MLEAAGDAGGAAFFWRQCAGIVSREPYPEWARNKAVYEYAAAQCSELGEGAAVVDICEAEAAHIEASFGRGQLDAAECVLRACQVHMAGGDTAAALRAWERAVAIQERHAGRSNVRERLVDYFGIARRTF